MPGTAKSLVALLLILCLLAPPALTSCKKDGMNLFYENPPGEETAASGTPAASAPAASPSPATPAATGTTAAPSQTTAVTGATTATTTVASPSAATATTTATTSAPATTTAEPTPEAPAPIGAVVAQAEVSAATGATFAAADGSFSLVIPPGALPKDTLVQVREAVPGEIPDPVNAFPVGPIYDFQPDGLVLNQPATVTYRLTADEFAGLGLEAGQQPVCLALTRSGDGTWEVLPGLEMEVDVTTGEMVLTARTDHFCTPTVLAAPVRVRMGPDGLEMDVGQYWSTQVVIENQSSLFEVEIPELDFDAFPRLSVEDGGGDITGLQTLLPGQLMTFTQAGANRMEAPGQGEFGCTITFTFSGARLGALLDTTGWRSPPIPHPTNTGLFVPQVPDEPDPTNTLTFTPRWTDYAGWSAGYDDLDTGSSSGYDDAVDDEGWKPPTSPVTPAPTTSAAPTATRTYAPQVNFWQFMFLLALQNNVSFAYHLRSVFFCRAVGGGLAPCFAPDTPVLMADGSTEPVGDIRPGEQVLSWDEASGQCVAGTVTAAGGGQADYYYLVNGGLRVTPPHPFYLVDTGWTKVADLRPGDLALGPDGPVAITSIERVAEDQVIANISVGGYGNYFVSPDGVSFFLVKEGS